MAAVSKYTNPVLGESLRIKEVLAHPSWKGEGEFELKQGSYTISKESNASFRLIWLNKEGRQVSVPFWIDSATFMWCYQNGQAHTMNNLDEVISDIFMHFKEKNV